MKGLSRPWRTRPSIHRHYPISPSPHLPIPSGFTLIELMVVISLLVILASLGLVQYRQSIIHTNEAVLKDDVVKMREAIDQYYADKNQYPETLDALVSGGYIREVPRDTFTKSVSTWITIPSEPDANNPTAQPGIINVKSGFAGTALDGTPYSDW